MPEQTNDVVVSGFIGLTVVLARRNEMIPARPKTTPGRAIVADAATRTSGGTSNNGATREIPHIALAISTAIAGGGILSSSACMWMIMKRVTSAAAASGPLERRVMTLGYFSGMAEEWWLEINHSEPFQR